MTRSVALSSLDKVMWPDAAFTKGDMVDYYRAVAPVLLPHLRGRPLTLVRFPEGVHGKGWYQTECRGAPPWMETVAVPAPNRGGKGRNYCLVDDVAGLEWLANIGTVELHPLLSCAPRVDQATAVVFDLDPGPPASLLECAEVALLVRDLLLGVGLQSFVKTSGWSGIHVVVPLNTPHAFSVTKAFARGIAHELAATRPDLVIDRQERAARAGRVLVDWIQNDPSRSTVAAYSLRAQPWPVVSTPLAWDEIEAGLDARDLGLLLFDAREVLQRVEERGDVFVPVLELGQSLPTPS
jgi:bifunctional non-homologous end joining protein LigD